MPGPAVHVVAADTVVEQLKASTDPGDINILKAIEKHKDYFYLGAIGPDLWALTTVNSVKWLLDWMTGAANAFPADTLGGANSQDGAQIPLADVMDYINRVQAGLTSGALVSALSILTPMAFFDSPLGDDDYFYENYWKWGDMLHLRHTGAFPHILLRDAQEGTILGDQIKAYALGYLTHIATDTVGHPFVNQIVGGPARSHGVQHHVAENHMDVWAWQRYRNEELASSRFSRLFPSAVSDEFSDFIHDAIVLSYPWMMGAAITPWTVPSELHTSTTFQSNLEGFLAVTSALTTVGAGGIAPPPFPSDAAVQQALSDMANDANSALYQIAAALGQVSAGLPSSWQDLENWLNNTVAAMAGAAALAAELAAKMAADALALGAAIADYNLRAMLYVLELQLYELWRTVRWTAVVFGVLYPETDECSPAWARTTISGPALSSYPASAPRADEVAAQLASGIPAAIFPTLASPEGPSVLVSPYSAGADLGIFLDPARTTGIDDWLHVSTLSETDQLGAQAAAGGKCLGSVISLWRALLAAHRKERIPSFNLDADRGYGYLCWSAWEETGQPPVNNPLLNPSVTLVTYGQ